MRRYLLLTAMAALPGCMADIGGPDDPELVDIEKISSNGRYLNGPQLNGRYLNGRYLNGVALNGRYLNGRYLNGLSLQGSQLVGSLDGSTLKGSQLVGVELTGKLDDGSSVRLLIERARTLPSPNSDVWAYTISFDDRGAWESLCGYDNAGNPVEAIALAGRWDPRQGVLGGGRWIDDPGVFSLGCRGVGATAKCVELGYKPWATRRTCSRTSCVDTPLRPYHQACTRMLRADYCGDGNSWTKDGTAVNVYDNLGIQIDSENWFVDAGWDRDGAVCVPSNHERIQSVRDPTGRCEDIIISHTCRGRVTSETAGSGTY